jgi:hypothetical protein
MNKICKECGIEKDISCFYKHKEMKDGYLNKCKDCCNNQVKNNYQKNKDNPDYIKKERVRCREKYRRLGANWKIDKENRKKASKIYSNKFPEKRKAVIATQYLERKEGYELHHWSYNNEHFLDIIELSLSDHDQLHLHLNYDEKMKMYKRSDTGELLDTKEKHLFFIQSIFNN